MSALPDITTELARIRGKLARRLYSPASEQLQADGEWQRGYDTGVIAAGGALTILTEAEKEANHE